MDFDDEAIRADCGCGDGDGIDHIGVACGVGGVDDDRQVGEAFEHGDDAEVEGIAEHGFEGADAAFAEHDVWVA